MLPSGLTNAARLSVDDTVAHRKVANGGCTQIGNDHFTWFGTTGSKSRLSFLDLLRAGHTDYLVNGSLLLLPGGTVVHVPRTWDVVLGWL